MFATVFRFIIQITVQLYSRRLHISLWLYRNLYDYSFIAALGPTSDVRAIAPQTLVNQDARLRLEFHFHIHGYCRD